MHEFLSWIRYVIYDGDLGYLCLQKNQTVIEAQKRRQQNGQDSDEYENFNDDADCFKGTNLKPINMECEMKMWTKIKELCEGQLAIYPNNLQQDLDLLAADDKEQQLTQNERSCVLFRKGEKKILHYLVNAADKFHDLSKLSVKDARKEVNKDGGKNFQGMLDYASGTIIAGLVKKETQ